MENWIKFQTTMKYPNKFNLIIKLSESVRFLAIMCDQNVSLISTNEPLKFLRGLQNALSCSLYHCHSLFDFMSNYIIVSVIILNCNALAFFVHCTQANGNLNHCILIFCLHPSDLFLCVCHAIVSLYMLLSSNKWNAFFFLSNSLCDRASPHAIKIIIHSLCEHAPKRSSYKEYLSRWSRKWRKIYANLLAGSLNIQTNDWG